MTVKYLLEKILLPHDEDIKILGNNNKVLWWGKYDNVPEKYYKHHVNLISPKITDNECSVLIWVDGAR